MDFGDFKKLSRPYSGELLREDTLLESPFAQFGKWMQEVVDQKVDLPHAVHLSTVGVDGKPSSRMVLLKKYDESGFVFFTNKDSRKGQELKENPYVSLVFYWSVFDRQVRIEGKAEETSEGESEDYFRSRPFESQVAACVSPQSDEVGSREELEKDFFKVKNQCLSDGCVPRPDHWGGYRVKPEVFEFWQGAEYRLHDRFVYSRKKEDWEIRRLAP